MGLGEGSVSWLDLILRADCTDDNKADDLEDDVFSQVFDDHIYFKAHARSGSSSDSNNNNNNSNRKNGGGSKLRPLVGNDEDWNPRGLPDHLLCPSSSEPTFPSTTFTPTILSTNETCPSLRPSCSSSGSQGSQGELPPELASLPSDETWRGSQLSLNSTPPLSPRSSIEGDEESDEWVSEFGYNNQETTAKDWTL